MFRNYWVVVNDDYNFVQAVAFPEGMQCGLSRGDLRSSKLVEMRGHLRLGGIKIMMKTVIMFTGNVNK